MPVTYPPPEALAEFLGPTTRHTRRIEIYEQDGITRWERDTASRLKSGGVSVDYSRDERRALDLVLGNADGVLMNAPGEFWYDKIIKVFRGVQINKPATTPRILIISDKTATGEAQAPSFRAAVLQFDEHFDDIQVNTLAADYDLDLRPYDIIVSLGDDDNGDLLEEAYNNGKSIVVIGQQAESFYDSLFGTWANNVVTPGPGTITPIHDNHPLNIGWSAFEKVSIDDASYVAPSTSMTQIHGVALITGGTNNYSITSDENDVGGKYVAVHYPATGYQYTEPDFAGFLHSALHWLNPVKPLAHWEVQVGEFMVDRISEPHFPYEMTITGRDYAKKCMMSKFSTATQFASGNALESIIGAIAIAAGITKRSLPATGVVVGRTFFFERGVTRWQAMKDICTAYNYEIFFDATGYLVIRPFNDPTTSVPALFINTGEDGQIASYEKSTSDAMIFNHILVVGESSDSNVVPVWAEAKNENPDSPTSIAELGDRYDEVTSALIETTLQAQALADARLAVSQLEEFELSFESLMFPWLDVGEILGFIDPRPAPDDPSTFLLSQLDISLDLAPMGGTGRRVTIVS